MSGPAIALTTVVVIFAGVWVIMAADRLLAWVVQTFKNGSIVVKLLLLVPLVALAVFSFMTSILAVVGALAALYFVATGARNWWHKGH